jgi:hypothetical protein
MNVPVFPKKLNSEFVRIAMQEIDVLYATVHQELEADRTRHMRTINVCSFERRAMHCGLHNKILLCMDCTAKFMASARFHQQFFTDANPVRAMLELGRRTIIAGGDNVLVLYSNCADLSSAAGGAVRDKLGILHKEVIPFTVLPNFFINRSVTITHAMPHTLCI